MGSAFLFLLSSSLTCFVFLAGAFLETHRLAEEAVRYQRDPTGVVGSGTDPRVAWTFPEIIAAAEAHLQVLGTQLGGCPRPAPR